MAMVARPYRKMDTNEDGKRMMADADRRLKSAAQMKDVNRRELAMKSDESLATWQSQYPTESPMYRLAEHEWQRRLTEQQIRASYWASVIGVIGTLLGTFLGWWLALFSSN